MNFNSKYRFYISGAITPTKDDLKCSTYAEHITERKDVFRNAESVYLTWFGFAINPFDIKPLWGVKKWAFYMASDIWYLIRYCNAVYMLKGWEESKGARLEHKIAKLLNYTISYEK